MKRSFHTVDWMEPFAENDTKDGKELEKYKERKQSAVNGYQTTGCNIGCLFYAADSGNFNCLSDSGDKCFR